MAPDADAEEEGEEEEKDFVAEDAAANAATAYIHVRLILFFILTLFF